MASTEENLSHPEVTSVLADLLQRAPSTLELTTALAGDVRDRLPDGWRITSALRVTVGSTEWSYLVASREGDRAVVRWNDDGEVHAGTIGSAIYQPYVAIRDSFREAGLHLKEDALDAKVSLLRDLYVALHAESALETPQLAPTCPICSGQQATADSSAVMCCEQCAALFRGLNDLDDVVSRYRDPQGRYFTDTRTVSQVFHGYECYEEWRAVILGQGYVQGRASLYGSFCKSRPTRVLEVGCGWGDLLAEFRTTGASVLGVDPSPYCARRARERFGVQVIEGFLHDAPASQQCDLIVYADVFEHIPTPRAELRFVRERLRSGGHLVLEVPNQTSVDAEVCGNDYMLSEHLMFYGPSDLARALTAEGFVVTAILTLHDTYFRAQDFFSHSDRADLLRQMRGERLVVAAELSL